MGPSGCGKSTLLNVIGCSTSHEGRVQLNGTPVQSYRDGRWHAPQPRIRVHLPDVHLIPD